MVVVEYSVVERGPMVEHILTLDGHADFAECGKDIVCSAVSVLVQTLASMLDYYDENYEEEVVEEGKVDIRYKCTAFDVRTKTVFEMAMEGFELLANTFPDNVSVT